MVQRASKFARYLPDFDIEIVVLTGNVNNVWCPPDPTLLAGVDGIAIERVPGVAPVAVDRRLARFAGKRSDYARWWIDAVERFGPAAAKGVDVIVAELMPYETAFGVEKLARELGIPLIADLQDPWALDEMWLYQTAAHRHIDRRRMRRTLGTAAAVVMNTPEARGRLVDSFPELRDRRVVSITNGFDAEDFKGVVARKRDGVFRIVHAGSLHTAYGIHHRARRRLRRATGGMPVPGVDYLTRSHVYLLQALEDAFERDESLRDSVELHLAGTIIRADVDAASGHSFVTFHGFLPHATALSLVRSANLLFLPMQDLPVGVRAGLVPSKTYEYMASGMPILAAVPDGDAREILEAVGTASLCRPASVSCMTEAIQEQVKAWRASSPLPQPDISVLARFEWRQLTADLAALIRDVVEHAEPPPPRIPQDHRAGDAFDAMRAV